jgi:predicted transcriptional regulator
MLVAAKEAGKEMRTTTGISLPTDLKEAAERQARRERRSLSSLISFALDQYLREVGVWKEEEPDSDAAC